MKDNEKTYDALLENARLHETMKNTFQAVEDSLVKEKRRGNKTIPIEERAKAEWDENESLRSEFGGNYDAYLAYMKNVEAENVKTRGDK